MTPTNRIPRGNATWRRFLLMSQLATEAELMVQKPRQARRTVKDEAPPDPPADFPPGGPHSEEEEP
jgi:hypothetical protein